MVDLTAVALVEAKYSNGLVIRARDDLSARGRVVEGKHGRHVVFVYIDGPG